jgi:hypothetical protein
MADRLRRKVEAILAKHGDDQSAADREIDRTLDGQEVLTTGLLPINSVLRTRILGAFLRERDRKARGDAQRPAMKAEQMVQMVIPAGGKCNIMVWMTKEQAERERASR